MMYYRMAVNTANGDGLKWISTPLASIEALIQLLHRFNVVPQNTMHVFMASSREELDTLLAQENEGLAVHSVLADQFLCERGIGCQEIEQENVIGNMQETGRTRTGTLTPLRPLTENRIAAHILKQQGGESSKADGSRWKWARVATTITVHLYLARLSAATARLDKADGSSAARRFAILRVGMCAARSYEADIFTASAAFRPTKSNKFPHCRDSFSPSIFLIQVMCKING